MIAWGNSTNYENGSPNAIAVDDNGNAVEVHVASDGTFLYRVGKVYFADDPDRDRRRTIDWGNQKAQPYDNGSSNAIALDNNCNLVEVHVGSGNLFSRVGKVDFTNRTITWGLSKGYGSGGSNSVALDNNRNVVEVHADSGNLLWRVGKVQLDTKDPTKSIIKWGNELGTPYDNGRSNSVAVDDNGNVVEVHVSTASQPPTLLYRVGKADFGSGQIQWGPSTPYDIGDSNAVALDNNGNAVEVHVASDGSDMLFHRVGKVDFGNKTIDWKRSTPYDTGGPNAIALSGNAMNAVEVHVGTSSQPPTLLYRVGKFPAKAFYICAHQDDWFYFHGEVAYSDLNSIPTVLVFTTAGDAACTDGWWEVREQAALAAMMAAVPGSTASKSVVSVNGADGRVHPITKYSIGTAGSAMYCLRLPCYANAPSCLMSLMNGDIAELAAVGDLPTTYSWDDLCMTLQNIVSTEASASGTPIPWVNAPLYVADGVSRINPGDHQDHTATGQAVKTFASSLGNRAWWWGYCIHDFGLGANGNPPHPEWGLHQSEYSNKYVLFDAYQNTVMKLLEQRGNPACASNSAKDMPGEWLGWGPWSHSELAIYPGYDPKL